MDISQFFKSIIDMDTSAVVICDTEHTIVYMNPTACERYAKWGGGALVGKSLLNCHNPASQQSIFEVLAWFGKSNENNIVHTFFSENENKDGYMVALRDQNDELIGYYEKHEYRDRDMTPMYEMK